MPDELVKMILEQLIQSITEISDVLTYILQYYCVNIEEAKYLSEQSKEDE